MYKIIGGDGKQYGPIGADLVRNWIAEGRANAQTLVQAEGSPDWRPLGTFPEFADPLGLSAAAPPPSPYAAPGAGSRDAALQAVKAPATALKVAAILGLVLTALALVVNVLSLLGVQFNSRSMNNPEMQRLFASVSGGLNLVRNLLGMAMGVLILIGATKMERLESYPFALAASIVAMVPFVSPCCWLGLPFGIWALVIMNKPEVKSHFN